VSKAGEGIRMKSYNHLYEQYISDANIEHSIINSSRGKRSRRIVKRYVSNGMVTDYGMEHVRRYAAYGSFKNYPHKPMEIYDGITRKKRSIIVPRYQEQVIHHMVVNTLIPIFEKGMYEHSYASLPNRGAHRGKKVVERWIRTDPDNCKYVLKMDIRKFFDSIPHGILLEKLHALIHDEKFLFILDEIISVTDNGLPLGFYTSQWLANWYLQDLDHYIKEILHAPHYIRYMDDMVIFGPDKSSLHRIKKQISEFLLDHLGLKLKENWQVFRFDYITDQDVHRGRFLDYMGFRFYCDRTIMRKNIMLKASRKARRMFRKTKPTLYEVRQMMAYLGWIDCTNTYKMYCSWIKPYINFQEYKRRMSTHDRREAVKVRTVDGLEDSAEHGKATGS
jgi:retron-type reverse transcriptase